jgi:hypothetical protein
VDADALAAWCTRRLGSPPAAELFEAGHLSLVKGLRLANGRDVVVKVRPDAPRLAGCSVVHRALWAAGFPCPEPLVDAQPLAGFVASAEALVPHTDEPPPDGELPALSAAALARLVALAPAPGAVPSLAPSPSWTGWDRGGEELWPAPEDRDVDLNACPEPQWLARVAAAVRDRLRRYAGEPVVGHGDWHEENVRWQGTRLLAVYDWDSVICQPEPAVAGLAAAGFVGIEAPRLAGVDESAAFLEAYERAAGRRWTAADREASWAAGPVAARVRRQDAVARRRSRPDPDSARGAGPPPARRVGPGARSRRVERLSPRCAPRTDATAARCPSARARLGRRSRSPSRP